MRTWKVSILACSAVGAAFLAPAVASAGGSSSVKVSRVIIYPDPPGLYPPFIVPFNSIPTPTPGNPSSGSYAALSPPASTPPYGQTAQTLDYSVTLGAPDGEQTVYNNGVPDGYLQFTPGTITITAVTNFTFGTFDQSNIANGQYTGPIGGVEFLFPTVEVNDGVSYYDFYKSGGSYAFGGTYGFSLAPATTAPTTISDVDIAPGQVIFNYINPTTQIGETWTAGESAVYSFTLVNYVPEPGTWALMLVGFAGIGFALRRRALRSAALAA